MKLKLLLAFILFTQLTFSQTTSQALEEAKKKYHEPTAGFAGIIKEWYIRR